MPFGVTQALAKRGRRGKVLDGSQVPVVNSSATAKKAANIYAITRQAAKSDVPIRNHVQLQIGAHLDVRSMCLKPVPFPFGRATQLSTGGAHKSLLSHAPFETRVTSQVAAEFEEFIGKCLVEGKSG